MASLFSLRKLPCRIKRLGEWRCEYFGLFQAPEKVNLPNLSRNEAGNDLHVQLTKNRSEKFLPFGKISHGQARIERARIILIKQLKGGCQFVKVDAIKDSSGRAPQRVQCRPLHLSNVPTAMNLIKPLSLVAQKFIKVVFGY